jgi:Tannase and feruloyl esterase
MKRTLLLILMTCAPMIAGAPAMKCGDLAAHKFDDQVTIESAKTMAATAKTPAHCDVRGVIWPEAKFAIKLPDAWNDRFEMVGNGGTAGVISLGPVDNALRKGFAAASTDTGHDAKKEPLATFAYVTPENPHGKRKFQDFAYLAVHETAVLAKQVVKAYYGTAPRYSYWVGCSTGGRQGLQEAQRYPDDFDGLVVGAPGLNNTGNSMRRMWVEQAGGGTFPVEKLPLLGRLVYEKCDAVDGLKDGVIDDPRRCAFDPARDLPMCAGADAAGCFTAAQIATLAKIYSGPHDSKGRKLFPGEPVGAETMWAENVLGPSKLVLPRSESMMKLAMLDPPPGPSWNYALFNFDSDPARLERAGKELNALNPNLMPLKKRGGKIVQYSGWADQQVNPLPGIEYYETVSRKMGPGTRDFYRLFMVPGMFHCNGGPGCSSVDWLTPLMEWVEKGKAPDQIEGAHLEAGATKRTRPLCPYPQVAKYKGSGSTDDAANFVCGAR